VAIAAQEAPTRAAPARARHLVLLGPPPIRIRAASQALLKSLPALQALPAQWQAAGAMAAAVLKASVAL
jgi:hypothetical protein